MGENNKRNHKEEPMSKRIIAIMFAYLSQLFLFGENTWYVIPFYLAFIQLFNRTLEFE